MTTEGTVSAAAIINSVSRAGLSPRTFDVPTLTPDRGARWGVDLLHAVWSSALRTGLTPYALAADTELRAWGLFGYLVQTADTMTAALQAAAEHTPLITERGRFHLELEGEVAWVTWSTSPPRSDEDHAAIASTFAHFAQCWLELAGPGSLAAVDVRHRDFGLDRWFRERGVTPRAGGASDRLGLRGLSDRRPSHAHAELHRYLRSQAREELTALGVPSFVARVEARAAVHLAHPQAGVIARELGVSERTLRRRLADEGTSLSRVTDELRRREACRRLRAGESATAVGEELGYSDGSAFAKAFRRWTGTSPILFRASARG